MKVPYPWTIDRSLPSDLFSWEEDDAPVFYGDDLWEHQPTAVRSVGWHASDLLPFADLVAMLDERFGPTRREIREEWKLAWVTKNFEVQLSKDGGMVVVEGIRSFEPEHARLRQLFSHSALMEVDARLRSCGEVFSLGYSVWGDFCQWSQVNAVESDAERQALLSIVADIGFTHASAVYTFRNQSLSIISENLWHVWVETSV
jgi:hypothetical protein